MKVYNKLVFYWICCCAISFFVSFDAVSGIRPVIKSTSEGIITEIKDGNQLVLTPLQNGAGLLAIQPTGTTEVRYKMNSENNGILSLSGGLATGLEISESYRSITPDLLERVITVKAKSDQRYYLDFGWKAKAEVDFYSFTGEEKKSKEYSPGCSGPEFGRTKAGQTFPFMGIRAGEKLYGIIGDTPGMWENRSFMAFDREGNKLSLCNGDGSKKRMLTFPFNWDATSVYRTQFDGWQHIEQGETHTWKTWIFSSDVKSLYDVQLAAQLALANAKGYNNSGIEAILRNTSYLLLRRNLTRPESDYILTSGVGYGWKQWVTDGFYVSRGLDDVEFDREAHAAVFFDRINYEENAQYYLIWSVLVKRAGGEPDMRTVGRAYRFIRAHEDDGLYIPPRLKPDEACYKTYHDQLCYDDDDAPSSNQGFHCAALMAAKELGFDVSNKEIDKAIAGYRKMFNKEGGYMATSLKQQENIGQDGLWGEVMSYVVFGEKLLPDDLVKKHLETTMRIQSPYGMRIISKANGDLLDGHKGEYTNGGSWFLNDATNYLAGLIHGMDPKWVNDRLVWRLEKELAFMPAFHESLNTITGKPYGHHLYCFHAGYWWFRREIRKRLNITSPDPVEIEMDKKLGIVHRNGYLVLDPSLATLRPK